MLRPGPHAEQRLRMPLNHSVPAVSAAGAGTAPMTTPDEAAWGEYRAQLLRFVGRRVGDAAAAEDIVHDVLLRAFRGLDTLRDGQSFAAWIFQIARRAVVDHYRARRPADPLPEDLAEDRDDDGAAVRELAGCLRPLIATLPEGYREAVTLTELDGLTQAQAADRLGLSHSGAKSRVQRGRRLLAEAVQGCCALELDHRGAISGYQPSGGCGPVPADDCGGCG